MDIRMNIENPIIPKPAVIGDAVQIMRAARNAALPDTAVEKALEAPIAASGAIG